MNRVLIAEDDRTSRTLLKSMLIKWGFEVVGRRVIELQTALADRVAELSRASEHIRTLQGILPICMHCHRIRDDQDSWIRLEQYLVQHSEAQLSHALCPECLVKYYPEEDES